jgi:hypothetical protein
VTLQPVVGPVGQAEKDWKLEIVSSPRKMRWSYPKGTIMSFRPD